MISAVNNRDNRCDLLSDKSLPLTCGVLFGVAKVAKWINWRINEREVVIKDFFYILPSVLTKKKTFIN